METQVTIKLSDEEKELIQKASKTLGLGHSTFLRAVGLERAREIVKSL
jgi:uncharacterized protein (DUF1778 family)